MGNICPNPVFINFPRKMRVKVGVRTPFGLNLRPKIFNKLKIKVTQGVAFSLVKISLKSDTAMSRSS